MSNKQKNQKIFFEEANMCPIKGLLGPSPFNGLSFYEFKAEMSVFAARGMFTTEITPTDGWMDGQTDI